MNNLQKTILEIICKISSTDGAFNYGDDVLYGLKNYIARHSLANDSYYVTQNALELLNTHNLITPLRRSKLSRLKAFFTFEHPIPASLVANQIKQSSKSIEEIFNILSFADCVTLVTKIDDRKMSETHHCKMPDNWSYFRDSPFARYEFSGIKICEEKIPVFGGLIR